MEGRKIEAKYESYLTQILISLCDYVSPFFYKLNFTPNHITLLSIIITYLGIYNLYIKRYFLFLVLWLIGFFFDCLDGYFARKYKMETKFGDELDHLGDITKFILLLFVISILKKIKIKTKILVILLILFSYIISLWDTGCQEKYYNKKSILTIFEKLCLDKKYINYSKHVGSTNATFFTGILVLFIEKINKLL